MAEGDLVLFTPEELARINAAIEERTGGLKPCWLCGTTTWSIFPGVADLTFQPKGIEGTERIRTSTSNLVFVCQKCGHTVMLNAFTLGLADIFGLKSRAQELEEQRHAKEKQGSEAKAKAKAG